MKNAIKEYIELTKSEKEQLWDSATFVFDTNVFLNLYRYSKKTRDALLDSMKGLKGRIWMPHQVACEFMENRPDVIIDSIDKYSKLEKDILCPCKNLRIKEDDPEFKKLQKYVEKWIENYKRINLLIDSVSDDAVLDNILKLFDGKTGNAFPNEKLEEIKKEGEIRYKKEIPPGYKDYKKSNADTDNNAFGDLIVWKQILNYAKDEKKDIIFVTSDQKEDWWSVVRGKTLGPRIELKKEFYDYTGMKFHMYSMDGFISNVESVKCNSSVVDEVKAYNSIPTGMLTMVTDFGEYSNRFNEKLQFLDVIQIEELIYAIEEKRARRISEMNSIIHKYKGREMPDKVKQMVHNLKRNIINDEKTVFALRHKRNAFAHNYYNERV